MYYGKNGKTKKCQIKIGAEAVNIEIEPMILPDRIALEKENVVNSKTELEYISYLIDIILPRLKMWDLKDNTGTQVAITKENLGAIDINLLYAIFNQIYGRLDRETIKN